MSGCVAVRAVNCSSVKRRSRARAPFTHLCVCNFRIRAMFVVVFGAAESKCGAGLCCCARREMF